MEALWINEVLLGVFGGADSGDSIGKNTKRSRRERKK